MIANSVSFFKLIGKILFWATWAYFQGPESENSYSFSVLGNLWNCNHFWITPLTDHVYPDGTTLTKKHRSFSHPGVALSCNEKYQQDAAVYRGHGDWNQIK